MILSLTSIIKIKMKLSKKAKKAVVESATIKGKIADATGRSYQSVERWLEDDHFMLVTHPVVNIISQETGLRTEEIITEEKSVA